MGGEEGQPGEVLPFGSAEMVAADAVEVLLDFILWVLEEGLASGSLSNPEWPQDGLTGY